MKKILAMAMAAMVAGCGVDRGKMTLVMRLVTTVATTTTTTTLPEYTVSLPAYTNVHIITLTDSDDDRMVISVDENYNVTIGPGAKSVTHTEQQRIARALERIADALESWGAKQQWKSPAPAPYYPIHIGSNDWLNFTSELFSATIDCK